MGDEDGSANAIFDYIGVFYNRRRRHATLVMLSPLDFENSTLSPSDTSLAASRLASTNNIKFTTRTDKAPNNPSSIEAGEVQCGRPSRDEIVLSEAAGGGASDAVAPNAISVGTRARPERERTQT